MQATTPTTNTHSKRIAALIVAFTLASFVVASSNAVLSDSGLVLLFQFSSHKTAPETSNRPLTPTQTPPDYDDDDNSNDNTFADDAILINESAGKLPLSASMRTPVVFWHGMGDCARCSIDINRLALERLFPGISVLSVQIGKDSAADRYSSYIGNANTQIDQVCKQLLASELVKAAGGLNLLGFSQGCQLLRGLVQRCKFAENGIRVKNFVSLGGQHQGVFGLPNCHPAHSAACRYLPKLLDLAYERQVQERSIQAQYWHDPHIEHTYIEKSIFLADINNEKTVNEDYKRRLLQLDSLVLVEFGDDEIVVPKQTSLFGYFAPNSTQQMLKLEETPLYLEDRIGLKSLAQSNRLHKITIPGNHLQYNMTWFADRIAKVYFDN